MQIYSIKPSTGSTTFLNLKNKKKEQAEKNAYINSQTQHLEDCAIITSLLALTNGIYNIHPTNEKPTKTPKVTISLLLISIALLVYKNIKQIQLSKQYNKEINNDTKNYA